MSNFNQYFKSTGAKNLVEKFFDQDKWFNSSRTIEKLTWEIMEEEPYPASYYVENGMTATHKVRITYYLDGETEPRYSEFEVPREIEGTFIIQGAYRIPTNKLGNDYDCRIQMSGSGKHRINFDYNRNFEIGREVLSIRKERGAVVGPGSRWTEIPLNKIDSIVELDKPQKELLKLTEKQTKKFMIKLDLDYKPEYITTRLIKDCIEFGDDRLHDLIIDKSVESIPTSFNQYIFRDNFGRNFASARKRIMNYFTSHGMIQEQIAPITSLCQKYWVGGTDIDNSELQVPPGINSIYMDSWTSKVQVPPSVAFNSTFTDLIDIADTPINNNTNLQNSLTVSCHITDEHILFDVFDKEFNKITIEYIDYLNSKVCASEYVDYGTNTIKPNESGMVEVKYRMKRRMVPAGEIDLVDLHPDFRLSATTRRIPFVNYTDSVRISMGTSMLKQSIPLINAQRAIVDTGCTEGLKDNIMNEKFRLEEGVVEDITDKEVIIKLPNGEKSSVLRRSAVQSINDVAIFTEPKVKLGQSVKAGDVIIGPVGHTEDTYKAGVNTLVLFHAYFGLVNEDALVISQEYAERIASYSIIDLMLEVKSNSAIKWIAPIGTKVKSKDQVVTINKTVNLNEVNRQLTKELGSLLGDSTDLSAYMTEKYLTVPNNIEDAVVADVFIQENLEPDVPRSIKKPDLTFTHTSKKLIKEYEDSKDRKVIFDEYPEYVAVDTLKPMDMSQLNYKVVYTVRVRLIKYTAAVVGEKITSRYGGKGVVSKVLPVDKMPIVVDPVTGEQKRAEVVMNPYSTINRKIPSVIMETSLGLIAHRLRGRVEELKRTKTGQKKILPLLSKYYSGRYDNMPVEDFIKLHDSQPIEEVYYFNVGCFSSFTPEQIEGWMSELEVSTQAEVLIPEDDLTDFDELKDVLSEEEFNEAKERMSKNVVKVDKKLMAGYMTLERLHHIPSYSNKVTTSMFDVDINPKTHEPIFGKGKYRQTGQKIGEMELAVLLARNANKFIESTREGNAREDNQLFLNNLLGLGLTVTDSKGYNQGGSSLKENMEKMKTKFRIKNSK